MLIGLDIGTTNVKAVAFDDSGRIVASADRANVMLTPQPGWSEQNPEAVCDNVWSVLREVIGHTTMWKTIEIQGVVFSAAMHGLVAVDKDGAPLTNFLLWSDLRADAIAQSLRQTDLGKDIYRRTGVPIHAMSPLAKLIWLRQNQPEVFQKADMFFGIKEFVWHQLTGRYDSDLSVASATGLLNIWKNDWDEAALVLAGISPKQLPELESPYFVQGFSGVRANPYSEPIKVAPLILGASDGALANLGSGATRPGQIAVTIGTSAAIRMVSDKPVLDEEMRTFCYRLDEERCIVGGASNNGTNALEWLRNTVFQSPLDAESFANQAGEVPPGSDGLLFLPYLFGERAPLYDASARGGFHGLTSQHGQAHFVRAAMEGVIFNLRLIAEALEAHSPIRTLHAGGGFSKNQLWVQMLADIFQKPVWLTESDADASVLGAIRMGREALGLKAIFEKRQSRVVEPNGQNAELYEAVFGRFRKFAGF
jgi:gluconokinase